jgi:hypothetical protein
VAQLSSNPSYSAVSYTWGDPGLTETLWIEDAVIDITRNLHDLLLRFRRADEEEEVILWVDAVCINQNRKEEKAVQIPLMSKIYSSAKEVLIWLGEGDEQSNLVMAYLRKTARKFLDRGGVIMEPRDEPGSQDIWIEVCTDPALAMTDIIWGRPWFTRRWVIQEVAFARMATVHCGSESMDWAELSCASLAINRLAGDGSFCNRYITERRRLFSLRFSGSRGILILQQIREEVQLPNTTSSERSLMDCITDAWGFECSVDKDRVFALLGILNHGHEHQLFIDYNQPSEEIYEKFAQYCIQHGDPRNKLDILSCAGLSNHAQAPKPYKLPSWVPDWRASFDGPTRKLNSFSAGHIVAASTEIRRNTKELLVRGVLIDRIQYVVGSLSSFANPEDPYYSISRPNHQATWYKNIEDLFTKKFGPYHFRLPQGVVGLPYIMGGTAWEALFRTLILDADNFIFDVTRDFPFWEEGTGFRRRMLVSFNQSDLSLDNQSVMIVSYGTSEYWSRASLNCQYRSLYVTERGYVGLGPQETKFGDIIAVPSGVSVPYVLRPREPDFALLRDVGKKIETECNAFFQMPDNGERKLMIIRAKKPRFQLVGECYTQGVMHGEAWAVGGPPIEEFVLY